MSTDNVIPFAGDDQGDDSAGEDSGIELRDQFCLLRCVTEALSKAEGEGWEGELPSMAMRALERVVRELDQLTST